MNICNEIQNRKITGIYHNYLSKQLTISLDNDLSVVFEGCAIVFDLGIVGHTITYVSDTGTLGLVLELKKNKEIPEDYNFMFLSRDIKAYENKNELVIAYKNVFLTKPF